MIELSSLTVSYGETVAVDRVDLTVKTGEIMALLGPSGCGKSSLLRGIVGLEPSTGDILVDGKSVQNVPVHLRRIGMVFQEAQLFTHRDVAGNIAYGLRGLPKKRSPPESPNCLPWLAWKAWASGASRPCPVVRPSGWRSHVPLPRARRCYFSTSRSRPSTGCFGNDSPVISEKSSRLPRPPPFMSLMTTIRRLPWPTESGSMNFSKLLPGRNPCGTTRPSRGFRRRRVLGKHAVTGGQGNRAVR